MSCFERLGLALLVCVTGLVLAGEARSDAATDRRVALLRAIVRDEPFPLAKSEPLVEASGCPEPDLRRRVEHRLARAVRDASLRFAVPRALIHSVIRHESGYDPRALSHAGAMGLMQLMPGTARELGVVCPFDTRENVIGGTRYLRQLRDRLGSWPRALAAYNAGLRAVLRDRVPTVTRRYVRRVLHSWRPWHFEGP